MCTSKLCSLLINSVIFGFHYTAKCEDCKLIAILVFLKSSSFSTDAIFIAKIILNNKKLHAHLLSHLRPKGQSAKVLVASTEYHTVWRLFKICIVAWSFESSWTLNEHTGKNRQIWLHISLWAHWLSWTLLVV